MNRKKITTALITIAASLFAQNHTVPGTLSLPYPTMENISVEWEIAGDQNGNAEVTVQYAEEGSSNWQNGMNLRRVFAGSTEGQSWSDRFAGSLFNLNPATTYSVRLQLKDPDGGTVDTTITASTRAVPEVPEGAEITVFPAGNHGEITLQSGTEANPRVYRAEPGALFSRINMYNCEWVFLEGVRIKGDSKGITMNGAKNCVIRQCTLSTPKGITAYGEGIMNCYIADNVLVGNAQWRSDEMGAGGYNGGEGIEFTGAGNVVCYNSVIGYRDCISTMEDSEAKNQRSNDIHNNIVSVGTDDGIEADFLIANNRIYRNVILNSCVGLSSQPGLGGPNYFFENVLYNTPFCSFKLNRGSAGDILINNTVIKSGDAMTVRTSTPFDQALFRNNLCIGGGPGGSWGEYSGGSGKGAEIYAATERCDFDYDAVGSLNGKGNGSIAGVAFEEAEPHGVALGNISSLNTVFANAVWPEEVESVYTVQDLRLAANSPVIDKGIEIPGFHFNIQGDAPDIGAYELGKPVPHYGPRSDGATSISAGHVLNNEHFQVLYSDKELKFEKPFTGSVLVFSVNGRELFSRDVVEQKSVPFSESFSRGIYLIQIQQGTNTQSLKLSLF